MCNKNLTSLAVFTALIILALSCDKNSTQPDTPLLSVSPASLDFGPDQYGLQIFLNNGGGAALDWTIDTQSPTWFSSHPGQGSIVLETDTVNVFVNRAGLQGEYADTLTISSNGGSARVEILMQVPASPTLSVYPTRLDFGSDSETGFFQILNAGPGQLDWNIAEDIEWLELAPASGSTTQESDTIEITVIRPHLTNEELAGSVLITSNGGTRTIEVVARDTVYISEGIFAILTLERTITRHSHMGYLRSDLIEARFDSIYSPCESIFPMAADSVYCDDYILSWNADLNTFQYSQTMPRIFISPGELYHFIVNGNQQIPAFTDSIVFPDLAPYITSPSDSASFSRTVDLPVVWSDTGAGTITIAVILAADSICAAPFDLTGFEGLFFETENDGQYAIPAAELSSLSSGDYKIILFNYNAHAISVAGYDPRSLILGGSASYATIQLQ